MIEYAYASFTGPPGEPDATMGDQGEAPVTRLWSRIFRNSILAR